MDLNGRATFDLNAIAMEVDYEPLVLLDAIRLEEFLFEEPSLETQPDPEGLGSSAVDYEVVLLQLPNIVSGSTDPILPQCQLAGTQNRPIPEEGIHPQGFLAYADQWTATPLELLEEHDYALAYGMFWSTNSPLSGPEVEVQTCSPTPVIGSSSMSEESSLSVETASRSDTLERKVDSNSEENFADDEKESPPGRNFLPIVTSEEAKNRCNTAELSPEVYVLTSEPSEDPFSGDENCHIDESNSVEITPWQNQTLHSRVLVEPTYPRAPIPRCHPDEDSIPFSQISSPSPSRNVPSSWEPNEGSTIFSQISFFSSQPNEDSSTLFTQMSTTSSREVPSTSTTKEPSSPKSISTSNGEIQSNTVAPEESFSSREVPSSSPEKNPFINPPNRESQFNEEAQEVPRELPSTSQESSTGASNIGIQSRAPIGPPSFRQDQDSAEADEGVPHNVTEMIEVSGTVVEEQDKNPDQTLALRSAVRPLPPRARATPAKVPRDLEPLQLTQTVSDTHTDWDAPAVKKKRDTWEQWYSEYKDMLPLGRNETTKGPKRVCSTSVSGPQAGIGQNQDTVLKAIENTDDSLLHQRQPIFRWTTKDGAGNLQENKDDLEAENVVQDVANLETDRDRASETRSRSVVRVGLSKKARTRGRNNQRHPRIQF